MTIGILNQQQRTEGLLGFAQGAAIGGAMGAVAGTAKEIYDQRQIFNNKDTFIANQKENAQRQINDIADTFVTKEAKDLHIKKIGEEAEKAIDFATKKKFNYKAIAKSGAKTAAIWGSALGLINLAVLDIKNMGKNAVDYTAEAFNREREL